MAKLSPSITFKGFDSNNDPLVGGKLYTYEAGTTTPKDTFTDSSENTANTNPVILNARGEADVWLGDGSYKFVLTDADDVEIDTVDNITGSVSSAFGSSVITQATNFNVTSVYNNNAFLCTTSLTLTLLSASTAGDGFFIIVKNTGSGTVTIDPDGSEEIDSTSTLAISSGYSAIIICDGTAWYSLFLPSNDLDVDSVTADKIVSPDDGELTIATGAITVTGTAHTIDTESDSASDDLDTINGGVDGQLLIVRADNTARTVVLKHGTGNIQTYLGNDISLDTTDKFAFLKYDGTLTKWVVISPAVELLDEDTMSSDSATQGATQQSIKAYVDTEVASAVSGITTDPILAGALVDQTGTLSYSLDTNIASISDDGTGIGTVTFTSALPSATYHVNFDIDIGGTTARFGNTTAKSTTAFSYRIMSTSNAGQDEVFSFKIKAID